MHAWSHSAQEAGRYLESYKLYERKPPDLIRERVDDSYMAHMTSALTSVRGVNKTDVTTLVSNFGVRAVSAVMLGAAGDGVLTLLSIAPPLACFLCSLTSRISPSSCARLCTPLRSNSIQSFSSIVLASPAALSNLPGLGDKKVRRLREAFTAPFTLQARNKKRKVAIGEAEKRGESGERVLN